MGLRGLLDPGDWLAMKPRLDAQADQLEFRFRPPLAEVRLRLIVGSVVTGAASLAGYLLRDEGVALFVIGGFAFFGLLNVVYAVLQSGFSMSMEFSSLEVAVERKTIWGRSRWRERLSSYQGVLLREEDPEGNGVDSIRIPRRYSIVELLHADPSKTLPLYVKEDGEAPRDVQKAFARRFHLPELAHDISGVVSPDTLRRAQDPGPPPSGVIVHVSGGATCFAIGQSRRWRWIPIVFWLSIPLGVGWLVNQILPEMALIAGGMAAGFVVVMLGIGTLMDRGRNRMPSGLCVGEEAVWLGTADERPRMAIPFSAIRQVRLDRGHGLASGGGGGAVRIVIDGGNQRIEFAGSAFDRGKVAWIRNRVLYLVTKRH